MGDSYNLIVIKPELIKSSPELIRDALDFKGAVHCYPAKFRRCGFNIWIAEVGNILVLDCSEAWELSRPMENIPGAHSKGQAFLERITALFPDSEIAAFCYDSRVGQYGYSVFQRGKLVTSHSSDVDDELPRSGIGEDLAAELFRTITGFKINSAEMTNIVGIGFLEDELQFDPRALVSDFKPLSSMSSRRFIHRQSLSWRGALIMFATIFIVWAIIIATR